MVKIILKSGIEISLDEEQGRRVLYAVTTLALTRLREHLEIERIEAEDGALLWPPTGPVER